MSNPVKSPNESGKGFMWAVIAIIVVAVAVIGYLIYANRSSTDAEVPAASPVETSMSLRTEDDAFRLAAEDPAKLDGETPKVEIFEDFLCPHCAELAKADEEQLRDAVESGDMDVQVRSMTFMDRGNADGQSHHILGAVMAVAETGDAQLYWNFRHYMMEHQTESYQNKWGDEELAAVAEQLDAPDATVKAIRGGEKVAAAKELSEANEARLEKTPEGVSSPRIFVDGKEIKLSADWVDKYRR